MSQDFCFLYVPCANAAEAETIAKALVEAKLAACANILPSMRSIYHWEGRLNIETETLLLLKTSHDLAAEAAERVKSLHSYECPCIVSLDSEALHAPYGDWLQTQLK